ncbi:MAG: outer membrane beta-barrel protein [Bacteroidetes bacterium]|nr:outer membrane beta-barrel protein [Bacteroidota bacterium]
MDLGTLQLMAAATQLGEVTVKDRTPMGRVQGDTVLFNADAFKVMKDANAQDLIEKMPTVTVENGTVKAQGENVQQVLVDGKPFFGNDPSAALKNLPAELIEKVQIFDQQSDQAQFTGVNDGNTTKTINIVTRKGMNQGQFGKIYAGYGWEDKYQSGGNVNIFKSNRRISLIGMSNNINVQNFSMDDILGLTGSGGGRQGGFTGGRPMGGGGGRMGGGGSDFLVQSSGGISTTHALGLNYSDKWGKKTEVTGSYFFNKSENNSVKNINRQFVSDEGLGATYGEESSTTSDNTNHRLNFRFTIELDSANSLILRPRATWQLNDGNSAIFGQTILDTALQNQTDNNSVTDYNGLSFNNGLLWRHKFAKDRRTFSVDVSSGYNPKNGNSAFRSNDSYYFPLPSAFDSLDQQATLDALSWNTSANLEFTEPVTENAQLLLNYRASWQQEESDKLTYDFWNLTGDYSLLNEQLSNVFSNDYFTQQGGLGYNYSKGRDLNWNVRANYQWAKLINQPEFPEGADTERTFKNVLPSAQLRYNLDEERNLRFNYRTSTQLPSIDQLQSVVDNSNPLQLKTGNPALAQSYKHDLFMRFQSTRAEKSTVFFAMLGGSATSGYIANATWFSGSGAPIFDSLDVPPGAQITQPVNLDGQYSVRSFATYGVPFKFIRSNLNFNLGWNWSRTPGLIDGQENFASNHSFSTGVTLSSNISTSLDFNLNLRPSWSKVTNTLQTGSNTEYFSQNSSLRFNWIIFEGLVLRTDVAHQFYSGLSEDFNQNYVLWNVALGKKLFKSERGEISLAVNDVLNQNRNISRSVTETYTEDTRTNALTRFVMLSFTYNIRHFGQAPQTPASEERRWEGRPPGF